MGALAYRLQGHTAWNTTLPGTPYCLEHHTAGKIKMADGFWEEVQPQREKIK